MAKSGPRADHSIGSEDWKRKATALFREMAADLSTVLAGKQNVIQCPLCLDEFTEDDINPSTLSREHIIPNSAGGKLFTLTCKPCNNIAGRDIDSHFARVFKIEEARRTGGEFGAKIKIKGVVGAPAHASFTANGLHLRLAPTTQAATNELGRRFLQYASGERELNFTTSNNIDTSKLTAAIVKMAYLSLFKDWGYRYALLPNVDWVRKGIRFEGEEREWFSSLAVPATITDASDLPESPTRMSFEANCNGINVACSIISGVLGPGSLWVVLPPMFDMNVGHHIGLQRAAQSLLSKSLTVTFEAGKLPTIRESA